MTWNWLDVLVLLCFAGQIALVVTIGVVAGRIRRGAVARVAGMVGRSIDGGKKLVATGKEAGAKSLPHILAIRDAGAKLPHAFRPIVLTDAPISYGSIQRNVAALAVLRIARPERRTISRRSTVGFAERIGLVPPLWKKVAPLVRYSGVALSVWQEVRKQLAEVQRRGVAPKDGDAKRDDVQENAP